MSKVVSEFLSCSNCGQVVYEVGLCFDCKSAKRQGAVKTMQNCYFDECQFLSKIAELEKKDYKVLQRLLKQRIERIEKRLKELQNQ